MGPPLEPLPHSLDEWLEVTIAPPPELDIRLLLERDGTRAAVIGALRRLIADHPYGADVLSRLEFEKAEEIVRANLPTKKHIRSGDLGEILATEYVGWQTEFTIPLKKLGYKDDC